MLKKKSDKEWKKDLTPEQFNISQEERNRDSFHWKTSTQQENRNVCMCSMRSRVVFFGYEV